MTVPMPDIFTHVHKGIRRALFAACAALGRAGDDAERSREARRLLAEALHFVAHHGDNEDRRLVPLLAAHGASAAPRIEAEHAAIEPVLAALRSAIDTATMDELRWAAEGFTARYLEHMRIEEQELEPRIRAAVPTDELAAFSRESVARTEPDDQRMMLGWMLPAIPHADASGFLAKLPPPLADALRPLVERAPVV